jgi:hypothetical protein
MLFQSKCIEYQLSGIAFHHKDREQRFTKVITTLLHSNPSLSFPQLFKDQHQLKGFYRLINNKAVSHSTFLNGYQSGLYKYSNEQKGSEPWILVQDTMLTDYNSRTLDLGYTQTEKSNGFLLHHGLLLDENCIPLGLLHQEVIHRERVEFGKAKDFKKKETKDKESNKWIEGINAGNVFSKTTGRPLIHIMDRESDIVDVINTCQSANQYFIIRARHDRSTLSHTDREKVEDLEKHRLFHLMRNSKKRKVITRTLRNKNGKEYDALCYIHYASYKFRGIETKINCVWIKEKEALEGEEPVEWFLLTNLPVDTSAAEIVDLYSKRWTIEDFHKCYKTGCSIEKRQFDSRKTLTTVIGLLALIAVELLRSRYYAVQYPGMNISKILNDKEEVKLAKVLAKKYLKPIDLTMCKKYSTLWWIFLLGRMGGHQGIKQKGLPGWQTIWKGYEFFQQMILGYKISQNTS